MIIFNEKRYAEKMLKQGFISKYMKTEIRLLAKYLKYIGKNDSQIKQDLKKFIVKNTEVSETRNISDAINDAIANANRYNLVYDVKVEITEAELESIKSMQNTNKECLLFTMLVLYRFFGSRKFNTSKKEIFRLAGLNFNGEIMDKYMYELNKDGFIKTLKGGYRTVNVTDIQSEHKIVISDFDDITLYYERYCGGKVIDCQCCKRPIRLTNNRVKYCTNCAKEKVRERDRLRKSQIPH